MDTRFRLFIILVLAAVAAAVWSFPTWYPLIVTNTVSVAFPGLALEAQPEFVTLPRDVQEAYQLLRTGDSDEEIEPRPDLALALVEARLLREDVEAEGDQSGFTPPSNDIARRGTLQQPQNEPSIRGATGEVTIYLLPDLTYLVRFDETFETIRVPEIHAVLTTSIDPLADGIDDDYIDIGALSGNIGAQTLTLPQRDIDFARYPILALYLPQYDYVVSAATLR